MLIFELQNQFMLSPVSDQKSPGGVETIGEEEESKDEIGVFMGEFSDSSGEGKNILGDLESEVMNLAVPKFRG